MKVKLTRIIKQLDHMLNAIAEKKGKIIAQGGAPTTRMVSDEYALRDALWVIEVQYEYLLRLRAEANSVIPMSEKVIERHMDELAAAMSNAEILEMMGD